MCDFDNGKVLLMTDEDSFCMRFGNTVHFHEDRTRGRPKSKATRGSFFIYYLPYLTAGVDATLISSHGQLVTSNTGAHFTHNEWMEN